jgi:hypothetical protein
MCCVQPLPLEPYAINENWRWRMAARKMMEQENVLSLAAEGGRK